MIIDMLQEYYAAAGSFLTEGMTIQGPPSFTESSQKIPGVRSEYAVGPDKIQFHFWPDSADVFPDGLEAAIRKTFQVFPEERYLVEYVPEVGSWYTHVVDPPLSTSVELAEHLIRKIARALQDG